MAGRLKRLLALAVSVLLLSSLCAAQQAVPVTTSRITTSIRPASTNATTPTSANSTRSATPSPTQSANATSSTLSTSSADAASASASSSAVPPTPRLDTHIDATFGILGALLIISGVAVGTCGGQLRRVSAFVAGVYGGSMIVALLILHFGVVPRVSPPESTTRGLYLLGSLAAGIICGAFCVLFQRGGQLLVGSLAGAALSLALLCTRSSGLIRPVGLRYVLILGLSAVGFVAASVPKFAPDVLLVSTSALGATTVVLGVDCFTTSGLKEFYVYQFGLSSLFPKLNGDYTVSTGIIIELAVLAALFICMMAFQYRFYTLFQRRQKEADDEARQREAREEKAGTRSRQAGQAQLDEWEEKYGGGTRRRGAEENEPERRGWRRLGLLSIGKGGGHKMEQIVSSGSATGGSLPEDAKQSSVSIDFLPKLDLGADTGSSGGGSHLAKPAAPARPALAPLQPSSAGSYRKDGWDSYLSTRQLAVASPPRSKSPSRSSVALASSPRLLQQDNDDEDEIPLAAFSPRHQSSATVAGTSRAHSPASGSAPRPATVYDLSSIASPTLPESAAFPRSHSRAQSLAMVVPSVLLQSPSQHTLPASDSIPGTLNDVGRRNTLIDLTQPSNFDPYGERPRQRNASEERMVVGDRRKSIPVVPKKEEKRKSEGAKIMEFEDLEAKHRKRLSLLQTTANDQLTTEAAKKYYQQKQQEEATSMRHKDHERRRSLSSNTLLASPRSSSDGDGQLASNSRPKSIASLSGLLKRGSSSGDLLEEKAALARRESSSPTISSPDFTGAPRPPQSRRQSGQSFGSKRASQHSLVSLSSGGGGGRLGDRDRRQSLSTLLETSFDEPPPTDLAVAGEPQRNSRRVSRRLSGGLEKVVEWRQSGTVASASENDLLSPAALGRREGGSHSAPTTPAAVESGPPRKKKNDWLGY
ncbi:hypothetical protein JCM1841_002049 [Sporobolomyces salmonicolor]